jgi:putative Ca2+/H+ antiporter (TMEM165/GDT1 family)
LGTLALILAVCLETLVPKVVAFSVCRKIIKIALKVAFLATKIAHVVEGYSVKRLNQQVYLGLKTKRNHHLPAFLEQSCLIINSKALKITLKPNHNQKAYLENHLLQFQGQAFLVANMITSMEMPRQNKKNINNQRKSPKLQRSCQIYTSFSRPTFQESLKMIKRAKMSLINSTYNLMSLRKYSKK